MKFILQRDRIFEKRIRKRGFILKNMKEDGACLFRAVSDQVFGDQEMHDIVRKQCMDYIVSGPSNFSLLFMWKRGIIQHLRLIDLIFQFSLTVCYISKY